jgi:hypothetical protein
MRSNLTPVTFWYRGRPFVVNVGPIRLEPKGAKSFTVSLAPEMRKDTDEIIPIRDFSVPEDEDHFTEVALRVIRRALSGERVVFGCAGGLGRTGLMLTAIQRICHPTDEDPIRSIRLHYDTRAVETRDQEQWIMALDLGPVARSLSLRLWARRFTLGVLGW